jgi:UDP-arabinose 4-epimerase
VARAAGRDVPQREAPRRPGDPPALIADPSLARAVLGWQAERSDLDTIIKTALAWEMRQHNARAP